MSVCSRYILIRSILRKYKFEPIEKDLRIARFCILVTLRTAINGAICTAVATTLLYKWRSWVQSHSFQRIPS